MNSIMKFITQLDESAESSRGDVISMIRADHGKVDLLFAAKAT